MSLDQMTLNRIEEAVRKYHAALIRQAEERAKNGLPFRRMDEAAELFDAGVPLTKIARKMRITVPCVVVHLRKTGREPYTTQDRINQVMQRGKAISRGHRTRREARTALA